MKARPGSEHLSSDKKIKFARNIPDADASKTPGGRFARATREDLNYCSKGVGSKACEVFDEKKEAKSIALEKVVVSCLLEPLQFTS
eukprot:g43795.t1